jgi:hypothetical protein
MPHHAAANDAATAEATDVVARWLAVHRRLAAASAASRKKLSTASPSIAKSSDGGGWGRHKPRVTACLVHRNRPAFLQMVGGCTRSIQFI